MGEASIVIYIKIDETTKLHAKCTLHTKYSLKIIPLPHSPPQLERRKARHLKCMLGAFPVPA
jgi:hypothetical protein